MINIYSRIKGGWKTVGAPGIGVFNGPGSLWSAGPVSKEQAMKLSAYYACIRLVAECCGAMSFQLVDERNRPAKEHDIYGLMRYDPNDYMTGDQLVAAMAANREVHGNGLAHIRRVGNRVVTLDFYETEKWDISSDKQGRPKFKLDGEDIPYSDVLHWPGFGPNGYWGIPSLLVGADTLAMQVESNNSAATTFRNALRAGGFFKLPEKRTMSQEQLDEFKANIAKFSQPDNINKWVPLPAGIEPVQNVGLRLDPVSAELLQSRYFGIEEICRFIGVPPPVIGHTDKASSWASSIENLNDFLVKYKFLPMITRFEREIAKKMLGPKDRNRLKPVFNMDSLQRGDIEKRFKSYEIGRKTGMYSPNSILAIERMPLRDDPGGDDYSYNQQQTETEAKSDE